MVEKILRRSISFAERDQAALFVFFSSMFFFISFAGTRLILSDEATILNQFYNLINGSLSLAAWKINTLGVYLVYEGHVYGKYSYSLLVLSLPVYYILKQIDLIYGAHLFLVQLWALSGGIIAYLVIKSRRLKNPEAAGLLTYFILFLINTRYFEPMYFPKWGELLSIEFTNILISSFLILFIYIFFREAFSSKTALFASFFIMFATPVPFWAITLKHHALSLFLTVLAFYFFYKYKEKNDGRYIYFAYALAGLCIWTRILDGTVLFISLFITDAVVSRRGIKQIISILAVFLISLLPFFTFNYLMLDSPFSIIEDTQKKGKPVIVPAGKDNLIFVENKTVLRTAGVAKKLGYGGTGEVSSAWQDVLLDISLLKLGNTFGIFLVSPFLIAALAFAAHALKKRIRLNTVDVFLMLYSLLFVVSHKDYFISIIRDTPHLLEYRYLLIMYVILLYFALKLDKVKELVETRLTGILLLYIVILTTGIVYFITEFPVSFIGTYYMIALVISLSLLILFTTGIFTWSKRYGAFLDNLTVFVTAFALAQASFFLLVYYWVMSMSYISPAQNFMILPVSQEVLDWISRTVL